MELDTNPKRETCRRERSTILNSTIPYGDDSGIVLLKPYYS